MCISSANVHMYIYTCIYSINCRTLTRPKYTFICNSVHVYIFNDDRTRARKRRKGRAKFTAVCAHLRAGVD